MRIAVLMLLFLGQVVLAAAQSAPAAPQQVAPAPSDSRLSVTDAERQYFELGDVLAQAALSDVSLVSRTRRITYRDMTDAQLAQIGKLAPGALQARAAAQVLFARAVTLMQDLNAPPAALTPVSALSARLGKPLTPTGAARQVADLNADAGTVLAALDESDRLSAILDNKALQNWATGAASNQTGRVWYAEGLMVGVAHVAAKLSQPDLLPPVADLATDLRGLRDWLSLRLPDTPTPEQIELQTDIDQFLAKAANIRRHPKTLTMPQVADLEKIGHLLEAQILPGNGTSAPSGIDAPKDTGPQAEKEGL